jgi:hypothetical protein
MTLHVFYINCVSLVDSHMTFNMLRNYKYLYRFSIKCIFGLGSANKLAQTFSLYLPKTSEASFTSFLGLKLFLSLMPLKAGCYLNVESRFTHHT